MRDAMPWNGGKDPTPKTFMRAFYSTQKHFGAFILGTPEGWQVSVYDLERHEWAAFAFKRD
jgi:hypothetical protein